LAGRGRWGRPARRLGWLVARGLALLALLSAACVVPWRWIPPPTSAFMLQERWAERRPPAIHQRWVPWSRISPHLPIAVVAAEDQRFPQHHGFDLDSISKALRERRSRQRGASTISQQLAKNLFLWPGRSLLRKGLEAWLTLLIELLWPKRRILEVYLNVVEFAPGTFGADAASQRLFGRSPRALTPREAALLAAVLPNPKRMSAARPSRYVEERADAIERAVARLGGPRYLAGL
jgi:monofunctional biosynthetic peptidoglycan transglycosylase